MSAQLERSLSECRFHPALHGKLLNYGFAFVIQAAHTALANGKSSLEERLARWLLMAHDRIGGDAITLTHETLAMMLAMALHELATNAVKYGALSNRRGRVRITWNVAPDRDPKRITVLWRENGGPAVVPPTRRGFGTRLVELSGARFDFDPEGISCRMEFPLPR